MKKIYFYLFLSVLMGVSFLSNAQNSYFFNQKNLISVHLSMNPRLVPMSQNNKSTGYFGSTPGIGRGTYYQYYDDKNKLSGEHKKLNLMLNTSYGRLFGGNKIVGVEFNYQKHYLTMNENANTGYSLDGSGEDFQPFIISSPVFNIYDVQLFFGLFLTGNTSPNKHLLTFGGGVRMFSLDKKQNYRQDAETPYTDLSKFVEDPDKSFVYFRLSMNYTYRILLTKNLCFDLGINSNFWVYLRMDNGEQYTGGDYGIAYDRNFMKGKLGAQTLYNMFYFRTGLSFAI